MRMHILLVLLLVPSVFGLGVTPARIEAVPQETFSLRPIADGPVEVSAQGNLADSIVLDATTVEPGGMVKGRILEVDGVPPGRHTQRIVLTETTGGGGTVGARASVVALLDIIVVADGPYIDGILSAVHDPGSGLVRTTLMLENLGSQQTTPDITITLGDERRASSTTLAPRARSTVRASLPARGPGTHTITAMVSYDGTTRTFTDTLTIGGPAITITRIGYHGDERGDIVPLDVSGRVVWDAAVNLSVVAIVDGRSTYEETVSVRDSFETRLYLDDRPVSNITVVVSGGGTSAQEVYMVPEQGMRRELPVWPLAVAALLIITWVSVRTLRRRENENL